MLSQLDHIIFPDRCEVYEIIPSQRYFYPIFKNSSSSLYYQSKQSNWKIFLNEKIKNISSVDVVVRDPRARFISGVNSFITQTVKSNPDLDKNTIFWFAKNYLHLNRHYCMQYSWLLNLARYLEPTAKINLLGMDAIKEITNLNANPWGDKNDKISADLLNVPAQEMYYRVDNVLVDAIGQSLTFQEINNLIQRQDPDAYNQVIVRAQNILKPTYVVSKT